MGTRKSSMGFPQSKILLVGNSTEESLVAVIRVKDAIKHAGVALNVKFTAAM